MAVQAPGDVSIGSCSKHRVFGWGPRSAMSIPNDFSQFPSPAGHSFNRDTEKLCNITVFHHAEERVFLRGPLVQLWIIEGYLQLNATRLNGEA